MFAGPLFAAIAPTSQLSQLFPPKSAFEPSRDLPDLTGKVIIVTGGNSGIGYHTVKELLLKNAKVYLAARSPSRCQDAAQKLKKETDGKVPELLQLDLADLSSVRKAAEEFLSKEERLDILFNNAGVMIPPLELLTAQGYDLQFGTNVLGHYFFTKLLLPALQRSYAQSGNKARVVNTSSIAHTYTPDPLGLDWTTVQGGTERDTTLQRWGNFKGRWKLYGASKLGNILVSDILIEDYGSFVVSCSLHPGGIQTDLQQYSPRWQQQLTKIVLHPAYYGALTQLWAAVADVDTINGKYLIPWARVGQCDPRAHSAETREELRVWLEERVKDF